ncbi:hypothetical protein PsYK624_140300 [Phanerochaete sordida]|uniref:F-box domain-containing protein n=1 Tax=Phanerochaete sordida TaxID=48140 RepID=A0A9P3GMS3_9APHY|nr:hypothetical protein PsYK624_140300 [Phanerochaete sordida]
MSVQPGLEPAIKPSEPPKAPSAVYCEHGLPIEVWERVIDHVPYDDVGTLLSCALTCSAFLKRSRLRLYTRVVLKDDERAQHFVRAFTSTPESGGAVRELVVQGFMFTGPNVDVVPQILPTLTELRTLVVHAPIRGDCVAMHACLATARQTLTALSIQEPRIESLTQLAEFITSFPNLRALALANVQFLDTPDSSQADAPARLLALNTLDLKDTLPFVSTEPTRAIVRWVCSVTSMPLRAARLELALGGATADIVEHIVRASGAALQTLALDFGVRGYENVAFDFSALPSLRVLSLRMPTSAVPTCLYMLTRLPASNRLSTLALALRAPDDSSAPGFAFVLPTQRLRPLFAEKRFPRLQRFFVRWSFNDGPSFERPRRDFPAQHLVYYECLPNAPRRAWTDDLESIIDRVFEM